VDAEPRKRGNPAVEKTVAGRGGETLESAADDGGVKMRAPSGFGMTTVAGLVVGDQHAGIGERLAERVLESLGGGNGRRRMGGHGLRA
jgi:hypothetical protein